MSDNATSAAPPIPDQAKEQAHQAVQQGKQAVQQGVEQGKAMAGGLMDRARDTVKTQLDTQKTNAATGLNDVAQALQMGSNHLQQQGQGGVAHYSDAAVEQITKLSGYLRNSDVDALLLDVQGFARQQPALFVGGAVLLGLIGARFLKSSSPTGGAAMPPTTTTLVPYTDVPPALPYMDDAPRMSDAT